MQVAADSVRIGGQVHVVFAFDIGFQVELRTAESLARESTRVSPMRSRRAAPPWFDYQPAPIRFELRSEAFEADGLVWEANPEVILYDFGAAQITYSGALPEALGELPELSWKLYGSQALAEQARARIQQVLDTIRPAVVRPRLHDAVEDYWIFSIRRWGAGLDPAELHDDALGTLARTVESERGPLAKGQIQRVREGCLSYSPEDLALIDWNAAVLIDAEPDDVIAVLKHANVELLELRVLDDELDALLDHADETLASLVRKRMWPGFASDRMLERFASVQTDAVVLFEGVNNAIKLLGNQYLARLHRLASARLDLPAWSSSVERKLGVAEGLYQKMSDTVSARRLEILEWVIIALITISILLPFAPWYH
ncbi:MAG: hypothetical protein H6830_06055 [Planctomycetes bacterium]|nr:hypothetical protein [Planctomycetota bacterium]MCB9909087.1 hypothetical protein [Planctomycetota bacterium]MCB9911666.1 hypothetical protein [Planctomycetota bacterium]HPF15869.1 hypothetical protein [Planctomycetota bacterium]